MGPILATGVTSLAAPAVATRAGGWSELRSALRLDALLRSRLGAFVVPTRLAVGHLMTRSLGPDVRIETAVVTALGAAGAPGLYLGGGQGDFQQRGCAAPGGGGRRGRLWVSR